MVWEIQQDRTNKILLSMTGLVLLHYELSNQTYEKTMVL